MLLDGYNRSNRMEFSPAVVHVNDVRPCSRNSMANEVFGKNTLAEVLANAFFDGIGLRNVVAADWL